MMKNVGMLVFLSSTQMDATAEDLRNRIRITYQPSSNNHRLRIIEELNCPNNIENCDTWDIKEQIIFDSEGRDVRREIGSENDFVRTITNITYESDQTYFDIRTYIKLNSINQVLTGIEEEIINIKKQPLYRRRAEPLVIEEWKYTYNENGLLQQEVFVNK